MASKERQFCNILRRVVVRVILVATPLALELISVTVVVSNTSTLVTPLARVLRVHRIDEHALFIGLIFDKLLEPAERPL